MTGGSEPLVNRSENRLEGLEAVAPRCEHPDRLSTGGEWDGSGLPLRDSMRRTPTLPPHLVPHVLVLEHPVKLRPRKGDTEERCLRALLIDPRKGRRLAGRNKARTGIDRAIFALSVLCDQPASLIEQLDARDLAAAVAVLHNISDSAGSALQRCTNQGNT